MDGDPKGPTAQAGQSPPQTTITLVPLVTDGADALAPDATDKIAGAKLCRVDFIHPNGLHVVTTKTADDLFRHSAGPGKSKKLIPAGAKLMHATLSLLIAGCPDPHAVDITPPYTITLECPDDAPRVKSFLSKHNFLLLQKLASILILILAFAGLGFTSLATDKYLYIRTGIIIFTLFSVVASIINAMFNHRR